MKKTIIFLFISIQSILAQEINVIGVVFDEDKKRISLGMKQLLADPWNEIKGKFEVDNKEIHPLSAVLNEWRKSHE